MTENDLTNKYNRVLEIIEKRLVPDEEAKKARGEVFTPLHLVREMLLGIRKSAIKKGIVEIWGLDKEGHFMEEDEGDRIGGVPLSLFRDSETKWLDPANGIGNFPVCLFYILDHHLGRFGKPEFKGLKNTKQRRIHIIEEMLFMVELNKGNVNTTLKIFKLIEPEATPNICCADTLLLKDEQLFKMFGTNRFDVIMGNPPYQSHGKSGDNKLYIDFIKYSNSILNKKGYVLFVLPSSSLDYIKGNKRKVIVDKKYNILFINDYESYLKRYFDKVSSTFVYFIYQNEDYANRTILLTKNGELINIDFFNEELLSQKDKEIFELIFGEETNYEFKDFKFLSKKKQVETRVRDEKIATGHIRLKKNRLFKYKLIDKLNQTHPFPPKQYYYYDKKDEDYSKDKIVFSKQGNLTPTIDKTHEWTYSDNFKYMLCDEDCEKVHLLFSSPIVAFIIKKIKKSGYLLNSDFEKLGKIRKINMNHIKTMDDLYKELKIEEYKQYIEKPTTNKTKSNRKKQNTKTQNTKTHKNIKHK